MSSSLVVQRQARGKLYSHTNITSHIRKSTFCNSLASIASVEISESELNDLVISPDVINESLPEQNQWSAVEWFERMLRVFLVVPEEETMDNLACNIDLHEPVGVHQ